MSEDRRAYNRERMRRWRATGDNRARTSRRQWERNAESPKNAFRLMIHNANKRASVQVSAEYLMELWEKQSGLCAVTGIRMTWGKGRILPTSLSIDRFEPSIGYVAGNIRLVCYSVNAFRQDMTDDQMLDMAIAIVKKMAPSIAMVEG